MNKNNWKFYDELVVVQKKITDSGKTTEWESIINKYNQNLNEILWLFVIILEITSRLKNYIYKFQAKLTKTINCEK